MSDNTPSNLVISDKTKYTINLFVQGSDVAIKAYRGCTVYYTRSDCGTVVFKRADGQRIETNMYFEAIQE